ncbi:MAG: flagellar basal body-associated FliL family protein, partial [bacterium]|nr:flagellar basal body-associated FliL family protein [bacterium]
MAEEEAEEAEEGDAPVAPVAPKGARLNQFLVLAFIVLLGQTALAYVLVTRLIIPKQERLVAEEKGETVEEVKITERQKVPIQALFLYPIEEILVNPQDDAALRFLSVRITLQMDGEEALLEIQKSDGIVSAKVRDLIFRTLNSMPYHKLDESDDRVRLREELKERINGTGLLISGGVS